MVVVRGECSGSKIQNSGKMKLLPLQLLQECIERQLRNPKTIESKYSIYSVITERRKEKQLVNTVYQVYVILFFIS